MIMQTEDVMIYKNPALLLQNLIRFDTTNPPGNEAECIKYIEKLLKAAGIDTVILGMEPQRPNLVARLKGRGEAPPFLMYGHVDVVTAEGQEWLHPPFDGIMADGCVWGRGALDMKGAVAMMVCAVLRAKAEGFIPAGDIILAVVSDEEDGGQFGADYLVKQHPELFDGVKYAVGELGGFTMHMAGKKFYPIMVAEKQRCGIKAIIKGPGGHGSLPVRNGTMAGLARILHKLNKTGLPVHITPPAELMIMALASHLPFPQNIVLKSLLNKRLTNKVVDLMGSSGRIFDAILHNTVSATIVKGGNKINVIPGEIVVEFDGRILPGFDVEDILSELKALIGTDAEIEPEFYDPGPDKTDMELFDTLAGILKELDKDAIPIPFVVSGVTDARFFSKLGIQTYGFTPMELEKDMDFSKLIHSANERIPVKALEFGANAIFDLVKKL